MPRKLLLASNLKGLDIFWDPDTVSIGHVDHHNPRRQTGEEHPPAESHEVAHGPLEALVGVGGGSDGIGPDEPLEEVVGRIARRQGAHQRHEQNNRPSVGAVRKLRFGKARQRPPNGGEAEEGGEEATHGTEEERRGSSLSAIAGGGRKGAVGAEGAVGCDDAVVWAKVQFGRLGAEVLHGEETRGEVQ